MQGRTSHYVRHPPRVSRWRRIDHSGTRRSLQAEPGMRRVYGARIRTLSRPTLFDAPQAGVASSIWPLSRRSCGSSVDDVECRGDVRVRTAMIRARLLVLSVGDRCVLQDDLDLGQRDLAHAECPGLRRRRKSDGGVRVRADADLVARQVRKPDDQQRDVLRVDLLTRMIPSRWRGATSRAWPACAGADTGRRRPRC